MVWIRAVYFTIEFQCCYIGNFMLSKRAVYENVRVLERYIERPTEDLGSWADRMSRDTAEEAARIACEELSIRFYGCDIGVTNMRYTEMLITPPRAPIPPAEKLEKKVEIIPTPAVPKYILEQIVYLEERYKEAETIDEKMAIIEEIDKIKQRYGIT